jgi:hypothetical protein
MRAQRGPLLLIALAALAVVAVGQAAANPSAAAPTVTIIGPGAYVGGGSGVAGDPVTVSAIATLSDLDAANLSWTPEWNLTSPSGAWPTDPPEIALIPPASPNATAVYRQILPEGSYHITLCARESGGNASCASRDFLVDTTPPAGDVFSRMLLNTTQASVRLDVFDSGSGISPAAPLFSYRTACSSSWESAPITESRVPGRIVVEAALTLCSGTNSFQATIADAAGNSWSVPPRTIIVDVKPPTFDSFSPNPFETVNGGNVSLLAYLSDDVSGLDPHGAEAQYSTDGGVTYSNWTRASIEITVSSHRWASIMAKLPDGVLGAVRWRATDLAGNLANTTKPIFFRVNGPPFLVHAEPAEGGVFHAYDAIAFRAEFADPDGDDVWVTWTSDISGELGMAVPINSSQFAAPPTVRHALPVGVHNITVFGDDHHGHKTTYTYTIEVVPRPHPDLRPFVAVALIAGAMAAVSWWVLKREDELAASRLPK